MGSTEISSRQSHQSTNRSRDLSEGTHRIDIAIGLLAASAMVILFAFSYFAFGFRELAQ
jgi:hypothetical protein